MQDIREKWRRTVNERYFRDFSIGVEEEFRDVTAEAQSYWDRLVKHETRDYLWEDLRDVKVTAGLTKNFFRLRQMAIALHTPGSRLEGSEQLSRDVIGALDWVIANRFNVHIDTNGNWWDWEIGVPSALTETILLMSDSLSRQQVEAYLAPVDRFTPDPNTFLNSTPHYPTMVSKGANRVWICRVIALRSLILEDEAKLLQVRDALSPLFEYVTEGEGGFCPDGSFLQHGIPYTGGYGKNLIGSLVTMVRLLDGSPYAVSEMQKERMYEWVYEAYSPLIFRGSCMDMANGREASRHDLQNHEAGHAVIRALLELSIFAPTEHAARIQGMVKYWILQDKSKSFLASTPRYLQDIAVSLLQDEGLPATAPAPRFKMFGSMARAVQQRAEYAFGISMFSKRVAAYESINGENKKGWYTGHGHTSLYNRDLGHYSDGYWPTVDPYRLAGITVTDEPRADSFGNMYRSGECWAGGVQLQELYGSASMALEDYKSGTVEVPLRALKSWFMFEGEIVALGSNICYDGPFQVETIVENRKLNHQGNNQLIVNGVPMPDQPVWSSVLPLTQWMHLQETMPGMISAITFRRPQACWLSVKQEQGDGAKSEMVLIPSCSGITRPYGSTMGRLRKMRVMPM